MSKSIEQAVRGMAADRHEYNLGVLTALGLDGLAIRHQTLARAVEWQEDREDLEETIRLRDAAWRSIEAVKERWLNVDGE